jgi:hypothetical protein
VRVQKQFHTVLRPVLEPLKCSECQRRLPRGDEYVQAAVTVQISDPHHCDIRTLRRRVCQPCFYKRAVSDQLECWAQKQAAAVRRTR